MESKPEAAPESSARYVDDELRQAQADLNKVQHELEQALTQIWNLDSGLRKLEESVADARGLAAALPGLQEDIRQLRTEADRVLERQNELAARSEEQARQQQGDMERERQERSNIVSQVEAALRSLEQFEARVRLVTDAIRRTEESIAGLRLAHETLTRTLEEIDSRGARNLEAIGRVEQRLDALVEEIESLRQRDTELDERISLSDERVRRQEERLAEIHDQLSLSMEIKEQLDRSRFERQHIVERLTKIETITTELVERTSEFVQGLSRVDRHSQTQAGRVMELAEDLRQHRETINEQLKKLIGMMERQRRRQAEALAQEIKELSRSELNQSSDE